jgi:hypothetical protein
MSASNMPHEKTDFFVVSNFFTYKKNPQPIIFVWNFDTDRTRERLARQIATTKIVVRDHSVVEQFQN